MFLQCVLGRKHRDRTKTSINIWYPVSKMPFWEESENPLTTFPVEIIDAPNTITAFWIFTGAEGDTPLSPVSPELQMTNIKTLMSRSRRAVCPSYPSPDVKWHSTSTSSSWAIGFSKNTNSHRALECVKTWQIDVNRSQTHSFWYNQKRTRCTQRNKLYFDDRG